MIMLLVILFMVCSARFITGGAVIMDAIEGGFTALGECGRANMEPGILNDLPSIAYCWYGQRWYSCRRLRFRVRLHPAFEDSGYSASRAAFLPPIDGEKRPVRSSRRRRVSPRAVPAVMSGAVTRPARTPVTIAVASAADLFARLPVRADYRRRHS